MVEQASFGEIVAVSDLPEELKRDLDAALKVRQNAYAPFSNFMVGACLTDIEGESSVGCNVENSSFGVTNCGERTAIFGHVAKVGAFVLDRITIVGGMRDADQSEICSPCGVCRQAIFEFSDLKKGFDPKIIMAGVNQNVVEICKVSDLLPKGFKI